IDYVHKDSLALWNDTIKDHVSYPPRGNERLHFSKHEEGSQLLLPLPGYEGFPAMTHIDADKRKGTFFTTLRPGVMMSIGNDGALVFQSEPISALKSKLTVTSLFPKDVFDREDF